MSETLLSGATAPAEAAPAAPATPPTAEQIMFPADKAAEVVADAGTVVEPPKAEDTKPGSVVPEKYEFKAPEGVTFDPAQIEAFTPIAKELGLTNEQAQRLVDLHAANTAAARTAADTAWADVTKRWADETRADKEIGGLKFAENISVAAKAIDKFGSPALRKALDDSGMGNHPDVVKFFVKVGRQLSEDTIASGNAGGGGTPKTAEQIMFPNLK